MSFNIGLARYLFQSPGTIDLQKPKLTYIVNQRFRVRDAYFMTFDQFLDNYYSHPQQAELLVLLDSVNMYADIESTLNDFYMAVASKNKNEIISQFALSTREFVITLFKPFQDQKVHEPVKQVFKKLAVLTANFVRDTYRFTELEFSEYFNLLIKTVQKTCQKNSIDSLQIEKFFCHNRINAIIVKEMACMPACRNHMSKPVKLNWHGEKHLDLFIDDLSKTFTGIKCKRKLYFLFDGIISDFKVELPVKHLVSFLTLFHYLHEAGTIQVVGNRGLFVYLQLHLRSPAHEKYPNRDFRKLRHEAAQKANAIMNTMKFLKPVLDKYASGR